MKNPTKKQTSDYKNENQTKSHCENSGFEDKDFSVRTV